MVNILIFILLMACAGLMIGYFGFKVAFFNMASVIVLALAINGYLNQREVLKYPRRCDACGKGMWEGYCIDSGGQYFCSPKCLNTVFTDEEFLEMYADGEGDSYWTEWNELEEDFWFEGYENGKVKEFHGG